MGQYYIIANLRRREFIAPETFGDGAKLLEFGCSSDGIMTGLALLTASGNGRGMGDLSREACETQPDTFEPKTWERIETEWLSKYNHRQVRIQEKRSIRHRIIVPSVVGSWAGDPIVTAGDYMEQATYMTPEEYVDGLEWQFQQAYNESTAVCSTTERQATPAEYLEANSILQYNLYDHALRHFENAGAHLKFCMTEYRQGRATTLNFDEILSNLLNRTLQAAYEPRTIMGIGSRRRYSWRTSWMTPEMLDSFLRRWHDPIELNQAKAWLRKQSLTVWQREFIKCYRIVDDQVRFSSTKVRKVLKEHAGIEWYSSALSRIEMPPILPKRKLLEAAIAVQLHSEHKENIHLISPPETTYARQVAAAAFGSSRDRVIDLDGSHPKKE